MSELLNQVGKFLGKKWSEGVGKTGNKWERYSFEFETAGGKSFYSGFLPWTKKDGTLKKGVHPKDLKEGQAYKVSYVEKSYIKDGMDKTSKNVMCFFEPKDGEVNNQQTLVPKTTTLIDVNDVTVKEVISNYFKAVKPEEKSLNHFVGILLRTFNEKQVQNLVDIFNDQQ